MKFFVAFVALVAVAAADVSHIVKDESSATITGETNDVSHDGFNYGYQTSNGIVAQESGQLQQSGKDEAAVVVQGSHSYTSPEGQVIETRYVADATGYHPEGAHLPTPPAPEPIPAYITRALEYIAAHPPKPENTKY